MSNYSFMEGDTFSEFHINNGTDEDDIFYNRSIMYEILTITLDIVKFFAVLGSLGASIFLICVILKFERLKTKTNFFFLHYAITCCIHMSFISFFFIVHEIFRSWIWMCGAYAGEASSAVMVFVFGTAVNIYWFLQTFMTKWLQNCQRFQLIFTIGLYFLWISKFIANFCECFVSNYLFTNYLLIAIYFSMLAITIAINVFTFKRGLNDVQQNTRYQSFVSTYIILSYLPLCLITGIAEFIENQMTSINDAYILMLIYDSCTILAYTQVIVVVYLLGQKNKYFKAAYSKVFKKSIRNYEDEMDDDSEHVESVQDSNQTSSTNGIMNSVYAVSI